MEMKDEQVRELVKKSTLSTSENFTDKLLLQIELEKSKSSLRISRVQSLGHLVLIVCGCGIVFFTTLFSIRLPNFAPVVHHVLVNKTSILLVLLLMLLMGINHVLRMQSFINRFHRD